MIDDKHYFWKNFRLGTELQVSGSFIYNGIFALENIEYFRHEEECFEFLYNVAVGVERLEKILIILIEHDQSVNQKEFEKSLITHDHSFLFQRIKKKRKTNLGEQHLRFLNLLSDFYKSTRYERFNMSSIYHPPKEKDKLANFLIKELKLDLPNSRFPYLENTELVKGFLGKIIIKITSTFYDLIKIETHRLGTFTHEIRYNSKAFKIFIEKEYDFKNEKLMQREVLLHLLKSLQDDNFEKFLSTIEPLPFENNHTNHYIKCILEIHKFGSAKDELLTIYEDQPPSKSRLDQLFAIGSEVNFDIIYDEEEEE